MPPAVSWPIKANSQMKFRLLPVAFLLGFHAFAQQPIHLKLRRYKVAQLPEEVSETSGLCWRNGKLYTLNDSGNSSEIFALDAKTGQILERIPVPTKNIDFEAIACSEQAVYIGDFGNNLGNRQDLVVQRITLDQDGAEAIPFGYAQQKDFTPKSLNNDWDAESLAIIDGKINVFSKEWVSKNLRRYVLDPNTVGKQMAEPLETYPLGFMATDTAFFEEKLYVVGYTKKLEVFLAMFRRDEKGSFFSSKPQILFLGMSTGVGQVEGISVNEKGIYLSAERFKMGLFSHPQTLYFIPAATLSLKN